MTHVSGVDLWNTGGNAVVTLPPTRDDVFVVTTVGGRAVTVEPVHLYDDAVRRAQTFVRRARQGRPYAVKVLSLSLREALRMGFVQGPLAGHSGPEDEVRDRQLVVTTLRDVMRSCNDAKVRTEAYDTLVEMGELK
jgi:hypothetical protein